MKNPRKKSAKELPDDTVVYRVNPALVIRSGAAPETGISIAEAIEHIEGVMAQLPKDPI